MQWIEGIVWCDQCGTAITYWYEEGNESHRQEQERAALEAHRSECGFVQH